MIIQALFSFTVLNHDYYKNLADQQQTSQTKTPTTRGAIYSANEK
jgi:cell division protein FtsI/penicillin-binding protein 2